MNLCKGQLCRQAKFCPAGPEPTLAMLFCSSSYAIEFDRVVPTLRTRFPSLRHIVGCTVSNVPLAFQPAHWAAGTASFRAFLMQCTVSA